MVLGRKTAGDLRINWLVVKHLNHKFRTFAAL